MVSLLTCPPPPVGKAFLLLDFTMLICRLKGIDPGGSDILFYAC